MTWAEYAVWVQGKTILSSYKTSILFTDGTAAWFTTNLITPGCSTCGDGLEIEVAIDTGT